MMQAPPPPHAAPNVGQIAGVPAPQAGPTAVPNTYLEKYLDPAHDVFNGNYVNLYNEYAVGNLTPAELRAATYRDGNMGTFLHVLVHVRDPAAGPNDPGTIVALHRLTRHETRLGQTQYAFDNLGLAYYGDVINGQAPSTVVIPDTWYNQVGPVQSPNHGLLAQEFAADPNAASFGPYLAGTADVDPVSTRPVVLVPNKYAAPFLTAGMAPRAAYLTVLGMAQQAGEDVACEPLLDWLRVTLTLRGGAAPTPATCVPPPAPPAFADLAVQQAFVSYRLSVFHSDFIHLQPGHQHQSAVLIAQGISALTTEQRLSRTEALQRQADSAAPKTPSDLFSVQLERLMRWCQASAEMDLPPIYATLANTKKGRTRVVLQTAIEESLGNLQYVEDFPLSTTLATKIQDLKWHSPMSENFALGLHLFSLGSLEEETMEQQRQINRHADALYGGEAAPSLLDIMTVQDTKQDVSLPRTFAQLRYLIERSHALWLTLLGNHHPVTRAHQDYRSALVMHEKRLERITTRDTSMRFLVPALLGRRVQLSVNNWLSNQARSPNPVTFRSLVDVFDDIELGLPWEPVFPAGYLQMLTPNRAAASHPSDASFAGTVGTAASTLTGASGSASGRTSSGTSPTTARPNLPTIAPTEGGQVRNEIVRNVNFNATVFGTYRAMNIKAKLLKEQLRTRNVELPNNTRGEPMCLTYHVHAMCNARCRSSTDHSTHTAAEDEILRNWCEQHYHLD